MIDVVEGNGEVVPMPTGRSVLRTLAEKYEMEPHALQKVLIATVMPRGTTAEQLAAFLLVANKYGLNPITREIFAFPTKTGGIQPVVSVDGWANLMNSHPQMNGLDFDDHIEEGALVAITARIWRKDREKPIVVTEYMEECERNTEPWKQWPRRMLRHKAMIQAVRYAFGFSGIVEPDEAEREHDVSDMRGLASAGPPPPPSRKATAAEINTVDTTRRPGLHTELVASGLVDESYLTLVAVNPETPPGDVLWEDPQPDPQPSPARASIRARGGKVTEKQSAPEARSAPPSPEPEASAAAPPLTGEPPTSPPEDGAALLVKYKKQIDKMTTVKALTTWAKTTADMAKEKLNEVQWHDMWDHFYARRDLLARQELERGDE